MNLSGKKLSARSVVSFCLSNLKGNIEIKENLIKTPLGEMSFDDYRELISALAKKPYLTTKEVATFFNIGINHVYEIGRADDCNCRISATGKPNSKKYVYDREKMTTYLGWK